MTRPLQFGTVAPWSLAAAIVVAGAPGTSALGQEAESARADAASSAAAPAPASAPAGILPVPDYSGELLERKFLLGDLWGTRSELANKGVQFDVNWTQYVQGVASGGRNNATRYGGGMDYNLSLDLMRMGVLELAYIKVRAESRYEESTNGFTGGVLPANTDMLFPLTDELDQPVPFTITSLYLTKLFTPEFGFVLGKLDTLDGDPNEFASGRGTSQFMNANFVFNSALALRLPYSTLGAGLVWMPNPHIRVTTTLFNTADSSTTSGFEDFGEGLSSSTEADFQYALWSLPGGVNAGFMYSFDQEFTDLNSRFVFEPGEGLTLSTADDTWAAYFSGWQYLWSEDAPGERPLNPLDGVPDLQGLGLFWRVGFADPDTNPVEWSASAGVGGRGLIPSRDDDVLGVGYFYTSLKTDRLSGIVGLEDEAKGFEAFYNLAITPAARVTFDVQVLESVSSRTDTAVVVGARLGLSF